MQTKKTPKAALDRTLKVLSERPEFGQRTHIASATLKEGMTCKADAKDFEIVTDVPKAMGGDAHGPSPGTLLRCAMASCVAIGIKSWAIRSDLDVMRVDVRFEADVDARGELGLDESVSPGFEAGRLFIQVVSHEAPVALKALIRTSLRYSPLMAAVRCNSPIETDIKLIHPTQGEPQ